MVLNQEPNHLIGTGFIFKLYFNDKDMKTPVQNWACKNRRTLIFGVLLIILGIFSLTFKKWLLGLVLPSFVLKPNSIIEEYWRKPPMNLATDVYLFNWTNPGDIRNFSTKPKLNQIGPYRFSQTLEKVNVVWNANDTVTYSQIRTWHYDEKQKIGNLSDIVTIANVLSLCVVHKVRYWNYLSKLALSSLITTASLDVHVTRPVKQILYDGYDELNQDIIKQFFFLTPEVHPFEHVGLLSYRNATAYFEGVLNMETGVNGNYDVRNWNYDNKIRIFPGSCSEIGGSAGELHAPLTSKRPLKIFYADACKIFFFQYEEDVVVDGILGYKYVMQREMMPNGSFVPDDECFCIGECIPVGVLNVSECRYGLPVFGSLPHFYHADLSYVNAVEGLSPEKEKHETYIIVEPNTGIPLKAKLRMQLNILLHPIENIGPFEKVPKIYFPLMWLEMEVKIPDRLFTLLKILIYAPVVHNVGSSFEIVLGLGLIIGPLIYQVLRKKFCSKKRPVSLKLEEVTRKSNEKRDDINTNSKDTYK